MTRSSRPITRKGGISCQHDAPMVLISVSFPSTAQLTRLGVQATTCATTCRSRSVVKVCRMDSRKHLRYSVWFKSAFTSTKAVEGSGIVTDLSKGGCRISSHTRAPGGTELSLRIALEEKDGTPLEVRKAVSRWARGMQFGVEFIEMHEEASRHLEHTLKPFE